MLYYLFKCHNCKSESVISNQVIINKIDSLDLICSECGEVTEYDPKNLKPDLISDRKMAKEVKSEPNNEDTDRLPTSKEMALPHGVDPFDFEGWLGDILEEFNEARKGTGKPEYDYPMSINYIKSHQYGWVKFGAWAFNFKLKKQYRLYYKTWREFCQKELHRTASYVDKIIKATRVVKQLIEAGFKVLPQNEGQARYFTQFWGEELIEKWQTIVDAVPPHYITSTLVREVFGVKEESDEKWVKVDAKVLEDFETKARERGFNPKQKLQEILEDWEATDDEETTDELDDDDIEDVPIEKLDNWQADLQSLIEENDRADNWFTKLILWSFANGPASPVSGFY